MNEIIFQKLVATATGEGATSGRETALAFNDNFDLAKNLFNTILSILSLQVSSETVRQVKVDTSTDPYTVYYTLDDESVENPDWIKLLDIDFTMIKGNPLDNTTLKSLFDSKATELDLRNLSVTVASNTQEITTNRSDISDLKTRMPVVEAGITGINKTLQWVVKVPEGNRLFLRYNANTGTIDFSENGKVWTSINDINTAFGNLTGNPTDSAKLVSYVTNLVATALLDYVSSEDLANHTSNMNNPHGVTKEQLGLGDVENYSPINMPISAAVEARLNALELDSSPVYTATVTTYASLGDIKSTDIYYISSHAADQPVTHEHTFENKQSAEDNNEVCIITTWKECTDPNCTSPAGTHFDETTINTEHQYEPTEVYGDPIGSSIWQVVNTCSLCGHTSEQSMRESLIDADPVLKALKDAWLAEQENTESEEA